MTAFASGTASDHADLYDKLIDFLTTDSDLVAAGEAWTIAWTHGSGQAAGVVVQGPGLSDSDEILLGLRLVERPTPDEFEIDLVGMTGVRDDGEAFDDHVNVSPTFVRMFIDNGPMDYWFTASGRRFVVVVKISTVFETLYGGFFLPYATPDKYSYPLFIGGTAGEEYSGSSGTATSWRSTDDAHRHFPHSYFYAATTTARRNPSALMLSPQGDWLTCAAMTLVAGDNPANVVIGPRKFNSGLGTSDTSGNDNYGYAMIRQRMASGYGGDFALTPLTLVASSPSDQTYGVLDGCYHVAGFENASENLVTVDTLDHLVVQDAFRTDIGEYWALALG